MTTHYFNRRYGQNSVEHKMQQISSVCQNTALWKQKESALQLEFYPFSPMILCGQHEEERWKEAGTYTASTRYWLRNVIYQNLETYQNGQCLIENRISRHVMLKTYISWSHKLPNPKLVFKNCRIKPYFDALVYNFLSFKAIFSVFYVCTIWLYTLSQCIGEQNQLGLHIIRHWRSNALGFCRRL